MISLTEKTSEAPEMGEKSKSATKPDKATAPKNAAFFVSFVNLILIY